MTATKQNTRRISVNELENLKLKTKDGREVLYFSGIGKKVGEALSVDFHAKKANGIFLEVENLLKPLIGKKQGEFEFSNIEIPLHTSIVNSVGLQNVGIHSQQVASVRHYITLAELHDFVQKARELKSKVLSLYATLQIVESAPVAPAQAELVFD